MSKLDDNWIKLTNKAADIRQKLPTCAFGAVNHASYTLQAMTAHDWRALSDYAAAMVDAKTAEYLALNASKLVTR